LGESSITYSHLVNACHIRSRIFMLQSISTPMESQPESTEDVEEINVKQPKNHKSIIEKCRLALNELSDEDSTVVGAPVSDGDTDGEDGTSSNDPFAEWLLLDQQELDPILDDELLELFDDDELSDSEANDQHSLESLDGLHWEVGTEISEAPPDKREHMGTKIKGGYRHLVTTPVCHVLHCCLMVFNMHHDTMHYKVLRLNKK
jgi:hypothetical protein